MDFIEKIRQLRDNALADVRSFLSLYEGALLSQQYLAADGYRQQHALAEGQLRAYDSILALVAP